MDFIFESLINRYDELVIQEYCYGDNYYAEAAKENILQKIGKFIIDLCTKIMNKFKEIINKITGKEIYVKAPKDMPKKVKEVENWFTLFKKAITSIKNGILNGIQKLLELIKNHPVVTGAILTISAGFIMVKSGVYKEWNNKLTSVMSRVKDGMVFIMGKKEMVNKEDYDTIKETAETTKKALTNAEALNSQCKIDIEKLTKSDMEKGEKIKSLQKDYSSLNKVAADKKAEVISLKANNEKLSARNEKLHNKFINTFFNQPETYRLKYKYDDIIDKFNKRELTDRGFRKFMQSPDYKKLMNSIFDDKDDVMNKLNDINDNISKYYHEWLNKYNGYI